jgi:ankyrin repeat protein
MKNAKKQDGKGTNEQKTKRREMHKKLKEFYAKNDFVPRFETINGKKVEQEYVRVFGLQNALHILMRRPVKLLFNYLIKDIKLPIDEIDNEGLNPFYICIKARIDRCKETIGESSKELIKLGANCDLSDRQGQTPFLHLYNKNYKDAAMYLLDKGANINAMSKVGVFALKIALIRRNNEEIKMLVKRGADIN